MWTSPAKVRRVKVPSYEKPVQWELGAAILGKCKMAQGEGDGKCHSYVSTATGDALLRDKCLGPSRSDN